MQAADYRKHMKDTCAAGSADGCKDGVAAIEAKRDEEITSLNAKRSRARIGSG